MSGDRPPDKDSGWRTVTKGGLLPYDLRGDSDSLPELMLADCADGKELAAEIADFESRCGSYVVAEERRLAYVAFTRAKRELLLTSHVWGTPTKTPRLLSRFVTELLESPATAGIVQVLAGLGAPARTRRRAGEPLPLRPGARDLAPRPARRPA